MTKPLIALVFASLALNASSLTSSAVEFEQIHSNLKIERPVQLVSPPDGSGRLLIVEQKGTVLELPAEGSGEAPKPFLDLTNRPLIANAFEEGLLNLSFHPDFKSNNRFYVYYTRQNPKRSRVTEFQVGANGAVDYDSERLLLECPQPYWNHNSGNMTFGADGFLYIAIGDGGKGNDATRLAQNTFVLNGKILRIDVDNTQGDLPYAIPADNPFAKKEGYRPEIYALGMRNPWGLAFDSQNRLWCADVGQDLWEEINLITSGGNYGWSYREGTKPFPKRTDAAPEGTVFIDPIHEYNHAAGLSITGGFVYTGSKIPELKNRYIYGDYRFGTVWALAEKDGTVIDDRVIRQPTPAQSFRPTAFCPDLEGEIIVLSWDGKIYRINP
ncbi:MAG: PQQ-dependent sugar dehydrogenase [Verrucomicrobiales bacterium]|nr:PQQ-dependent sugar dehydrogenase [Verrucomicrobiales bacterium]